ncbi:MAG: hypothetical protein H0U49_10755 [Parachlamydiaceae bacterium]|nr:hypothetical protein [Parachlamydiaceae bacterium]
MPIAPLPPAAFQVTPKADIFKTQGNITHQNSLAQKRFRIAYNSLSVFIFPIGICRLIIFAAKKNVPAIVVPGLVRFDLASKEVPN